MSLKDIEKLKEKVEKDPNSKLFVPLAEEYRKEGILDEAIKVLLNGLESQPGYMSARVLLGKIYIEKEMLNEARTEFESVIESIPDNLYAHKKLSGIYRDIGEIDLAIKSYKIILKLNPMDEDALDRLRELEGEEPAQVPSEESPAFEPPLSEEITMPEEELEEIDVSDTAEEAASADEIKLDSAFDEEKLTEFENSLFGGDVKEEVSEGITEEILDQEDEDIKMLDEQVEGTEEEISFADIAEASETEESEIFDELESKDISEESNTEEIKEETLADEEKPLVDLMEPPEQSATIDDAERQISKGNYFEAMKIYQGILSSNPDDRKVLQRVEDFRALLKLMGKDKEVIISKLTLFLEAIRKKHNGFLGSS